MMDGEEEPDSRGVRMSELRIGILTISQSCAVEDAEDITGRALIDAVEGHDWLVISYHCCPDDEECVTASMVEICEADEADVLLTVGGVGLNPTDVAPEVTERISERIVPGLAEIIRAHARADDPGQALSRATAGTHRETLIVNLSGEEAQAVRSFDLIVDLLETAVGQIRSDQ